MKLNDLQKQIKKLNNNLDGISDGLVSAIDNYQREYERLILMQDLELDKTNRLVSKTSNYNKITKLSPMEKLGFNKIAIRHIGEYDNVAENQLLFNKRLGIKTELNKTDITVIKKLKEFDLANMYGEADILDNLVKKRLVSAIALNADWNETIKGLSKDLLGTGLKDGKLARYAETYMRTSLYGLSRTVDKQIYDKLEEDKYLYIGPAPDKIIRPFCEEHVGNTYTMAEIEQFPEENGSGLDPFFAPGGYNCRHRLIPISATK